jgi:hypothetical protein
MQTVRNHPATESAPPRRRAAPLRRAAGRSFGKWSAIGLVALAGIAALIASGALLWSRLDLFGERTVDRTGPTLLAAVQDLHTYEAASGRFQVLVDIEKDAKWMPSVIRGERTLLSAEGTVTAGVDFASLAEGNIAVDPATGVTKLTLPHATLSAPHLDLATSRVVARKRGALDRIGAALGDAPSDIDVYRIAEGKIAAAARGSDLVAKAEANTEAMLRALANGLGHTDVKVVFVNPIAAGLAANA